MTKQRILLATLTTIALGMLGAGCGNNDAATKKPDAQIQADAQKSAADQAKMYQQKAGQQGQK